MPFLLAYRKRDSTAAGAGIDAGDNMRFSRQWDLRNEIDARTTPLHGSVVFILMLILVYLLTAIGLTPGASTTVHIYTQAIHRTTQ